MVYNIQVIAEACVIVTETCLTTYTHAEHPQIVKFPNTTLEVYAGTTVTYTCVGYGEDEPPDITWKFGDQLLSNGTSFLATIYNSQIIDDDDVVYSQSILELRSVEVKNSGMYSCTANNSRGSNSSTFILNILNLCKYIIAWIKPELLL